MLIQVGSKYKPIMYRSDLNSSWKYDGYTNIRNHDYCWVCTLAVL